MGAMLLPRHAKEQEQEHRGQGPLLRGAMLFDQ